MFHEETIGGDLRDGSPLGCADPPIFVPSASGRKWSPFFDNTDSATQLHHAHLSDGSGHDSLQTSTKDSLVQHTDRMLMVRPREIVNSTSALANPTHGVRASIRNDGRYR